MRVLILGGTGFIGPHVVKEALDRGWSVTVFNRGLSPNAPPPEVEVRRGDRKTGDLDSVATGTWDAVIDDTAYYPRVVRQMRERLGDRGGRYLLVTSVSVYADTARPADEGSPLATVADPTTEEVTGETYGGLKVLCEQAAGPDAVIVRPGLIVGPLDPTDRFTYWPARIDRGGDVLVPGRRDDPVQLIDVRDLATWMLDLAADGAPGPYNAVCPPLPWGRVIDACVGAASGDARIRWVPDADERGLQPWSDLPLWVPPTGEYAGMHRTSTAKALASGLRCRPIEETVRDTLAWWRSLPEERRVLRAGMSPEREAEVLATL